MKRLKDVTKAYRLVIGVDPLILNLGTRWVEMLTSRCGWFIAGKEAFYY
jgi:hypothetical protein